MPLRVSNSGSFYGVYEDVNERSRVSSLYTLEQIARERRRADYRSFVSFGHGASSTRRHAYVLLSSRAEGSLTASYLIQAATGKKVGHNSFCRVFRWRPLLLKVSRSLS